MYEHIFLVAKGYKQVQSIFIVEICTTPTLLLEGTNSVFVSLFCEFDHGGRLTSQKTKSPLVDRIY